MTRFNAWVQQLPAPVRHFVGVFIASAFIVFVTAFAHSGSVFGMDWADTARTALDRGLLTALASVGVLAVTPLSKAYGVAAQKDTLPDMSPYLVPDQPWNGADVTADPGADDGSVVSLDLVEQMAQAAHVAQEPAADVVSEPDQSGLLEPDQSGLLEPDQSGLLEPDQSGLLEPSGTDEVHRKVITPDEETQ